MTNLLEELARVREEGARCEACPLGKTARTTVVYRGDPAPLVLFIGQSPGVDEDALGIPFVGRAGKELDLKLLAAPFPRYGVTNAVLHHPPGNEYRREYGTACAPFLTRIVRAARPKMLVPMGRDAQHAVRALPAGLCLIVPLIHPAAMLHDPAKRGDWDRGWVTLRERLEREGVR